MSIAIAATTRTDLGKGASRRLRRQADAIPAILFGGTKNQKPVALTLQHKDILKVSEEPKFYSSVLSLNVDGKTEAVILKDLQRHPAKRQIMHCDFQRISKNHAVNILVPIKFLNETTCAAVKVGGGRISHQMICVEVTCLPADIPEYITIDMQEVPLGGIVHLSDLAMPKGVQVRALRLGKQHDQAIANIITKRGAN
jgi:large subunit ribosomal protein L25